MSHLMLRPRRTHRRRVGGFSFGNILSGAVNIGKTLHDVAKNTGAIGKILPLIGHPNAGAYARKLGYGRRRRRVGRGPISSIASLFGLGRRRRAPRRRVGRGPISTIASLFGLGRKRRTYRRRVGRSPISYIGRLM